MLGAIVALLMGGMVLMGTIAFSGQKYFEWQHLQATEQGARPDPPLPAPGRHQNSKPC